MEIGSSSPGGMPFSNYGQEVEAASAGAATTSSGKDESCAAATEAAEALEEPRAACAEEGRAVPAVVRYRECLKNHAAAMGGYALDGCGEFMPGADDALTCAVCRCHRNFHRRHPDGEVAYPADAPAAPPCNWPYSYHRGIAADQQEQYHAPHRLALPPPPPPLPTIMLRPPAAPLLAPSNLTPPPSNGAASGDYPRAHAGLLEDPSILPYPYHPHHHHQYQHIGGPPRGQYYPNSSSFGLATAGSMLMTRAGACAVGGGPPYHHHAGAGAGAGGGKRFRTKFSMAQREKMFEFAEKIGWRIQKDDEAAVQQFCLDAGVKRHVLKVWMHNNKNTFGKKL